MIVKELCDVLEQWAPTANAEGFDNVGLLVGDAATQISNVLVAHDALENVVDEAIAKNCNVIVCFHPIIFSGLKSLTGKNYVERAVLKAVKNDVAIYAIHTALDNVQHGVNFGMCKALGIENPEILIPKAGTIQKLVTYVPNAAAKEVSRALFDAGAGQIGNYDECSFSVAGSGTFRASEKANPVVGEIGNQHTEQETQLHFTFEKRLQSQILNALFKSHPYEEVAYEVSNLENKNQNLGMGMVGMLPKTLSEDEFLSLIKNKFETGGVRHSTLLNKSVSKVAVLGGSGAFAIKAAIRSGADAYITADLKYHDYYQAENRILLADVGHYESERYTKNIIADYLTEKNRSFAVILSEENTNPINYF